MHSNLLSFMEIRIRMEEFMHWTLVFTVIVDIAVVGDAR